MLKYPLKDMDTDETSWSLKIPHCLPNHVAILIVFFPQKIKELVCEIRIQAGDPLALQ